MTYCTKRILVCVCKCARKQLSNPNESIQEECSSIDKFSVSIAMDNIHGYEDDVYLRVWAFSTCLSI